MLITKLLHLSLQKVYKTYILQELINENQTANIKGRYIGENAMLIFDTNTIETIFLAVLIQVSLTKDVFFTRNLSVENLLNHVIKLL